MMNTDNNTTITPANTNGGTFKNQFIKVKDGRNRPVRGLWRRGDRFYAQMAVADEHGLSKVRKVPLDARTVADAIKAQRTLLVAREQGTMEVPRQRVTFAFLAQQYLEHFAPPRKPVNTFRSERSTIGILAEVFGQLPLSHITGPRIDDFLSAKLKGGLSTGTLNRYHSILNNTLKFAATRGYISKLPKAGWLPYTPKVPALITEEDLNKFCSRALELERPQSFVDYIRLLAFSGGRRQETLQLLWSDVLWESKQLRFRGEHAKNGQTRHIEFNPELEALLLEMRTRRYSDSYIFPSPRDLGEEKSRSNYSYDFTMTAASLPDCPLKHLHQLKHYFVSTAVMAKVDFMTIANWAGHQDGGILIGKTYGHINTEHKHRMAATLRFKSEGNQCKQ